MSHEELGSKIVFMFHPCRLIGINRSVYTGLEDHSQPYPVQNLFIFLMLTFLLLQKDDSLVYLDTLDLPD